MNKRHFFALLPLLAPLWAPCPALAAGGAGGEAATGPSSQLQAALTIYGGGIPFGKMDLDATLRSDAYHAVSNFQTSGVVSTFWQAEIQATSSGKVGAKGLEPALYDSYDIGRSGKKQEVSLTYENGAAPRLFADPVYETRGYDVKADEQKGTLDPLSAVMQIVTGAAASPSNPCGLVAPVFDGRRRYDIELSKAKDIDIKMDNGLYAGKGLLCQVKYKQIGGYKPNIIKNKDSFPTINAWIATFPSALPGRSYVVPLRLWVDSSFGVISVVATSLKIDGQAPK
jgi:hypothetical protein